MRRVPKGIRGGPLKPEYNRGSAVSCRSLVCLKGPIIRAARIISLRNGSWVRRVRREPHAAVQAEPRPPGIISSGEHEINHPLLYIVCNDIQGHLEHMIAHLWNSMNLHGEETGVIPAWRQVGRHVCEAREERRKEAKGRRKKKGGELSQRKGTLCGGWKCPSTCKKANMVNVKLECQYFLYLASGQLNRATVRHANIRPRCAQ